MFQQGCNQMLKKLSGEGMGFDKIRWMWQIKDGFKWL
jgi:hypothetical protein